MPHSSLLRQTLSDFRRPARWWGLGWFLFGWLLLIFLPGLRLSGPAWLVDWLGLLAWGEMASSDRLLAGLGLGLLLPVGLGIQAAWLGSQLLTAEREGGTLGLLLASPMPRSRLLDAKIAAFLLLLGLQGLGMGLLFELCNLALGLGLPFGRLWISVLHGLLLGLLVGGVSLLTSAWGAGRRWAFAWGLISLLVIVLHNLLASLFRMNWLEVTSLLQAAANGGILQLQPLGWHTTVLAGGVVCLLWLARSAFSNRDLEI